MSDGGPLSDPGDIESGTWIIARPGGREALRVRKCRLEVIAGPDAGRVETYASPLIQIGRAGADLALTDRRVSALHAELHIEDGGYRLRDLGSTNGTFAWGMRIVEAFVAPGAVIHVGESAVRFVPLADSVELPLWQEARMGSLVGKSPAMRRLFELIDRVAASDATVLITGETGTGKELVAEAIHERSPRAQGAFVVLDCGAVPGALFEDHLFGHDAGAFTGAVRDSAGVFEAAHGGTLFLDEIGELPMDVQPKLLRAVETRRIRPVGSSRNVECDVRLVAATNRDLAASVNRDTFRADLFYRVAVARLHVPPLRERREDIDLLVEHFLDTLPGGRAAPLPDGFLDWARKHTWPGNVRELKNAVERAIALRAHPEAIPAAEEPPDLEIDVSVPFKEAKRRIVDSFDRRYIRALLTAHGGNISAVARAAGLDRMSIYKMLERLGLRDATRR